METKLRIIKIAKNIIADWFSFENYPVEQYPSGPPFGGPWRKTNKGWSDVQNKKHNHTQEVKKTSLTEELAEAIKTQTPEIIRTPYDEGVESSVNDVYFLKYGDKKTVFKPTTTIDQDTRDTLTLGVVPSSKREVMSFEISEKLGLNVVPPTFFTKHTVPSLSDDWMSLDLEDKEKDGSEQSFVEGETWMQYCLREGQDKVRETLKDETVQKNLGMLAITDYLIGNSDRHMSNFIINDKKQLFGIDNGLSFAPNGETNLEGNGEFRSLPLDILYRMYEDYDPDFSVSQMRFEDYNTSEFLTDYEMMTKLEILKDANGIHAEVADFFKNIDYDKAEKNISDIMNHYGMDEKSSQSTISRLRDIQWLFND